MTEEQATAVLDKLDSIIALLARREVAGLSKTDAMLLLHSLGVSIPIIANATGSTKHTVEVRLSEKRSKSK